MPGTKPYSQYAAISFDIFGTVLDDERGVMAWVTPLAAHLPPDSPLRATPFPYPKPAPGQDLPQRHPLIVAVHKHERVILAEDPAPLFEDAMRRVFLAVAADLKTPWSSEQLSAKADAFSHSAGVWPAFPDSVNALRALGRHGAGKKLIALSNVSNQSIRAVLEGPLKGADFDAVYTGENIGAYKPNDKNFHYLLNGLHTEFGLGKDQLLHVAHGVRSDQVPGEKFAFDHVWVERGVDNWEDLDRKEMERLAVEPDLKAVADKVATGK